jgi:hypothetical protein
MSDENSQQDECSGEQTEHGGRTPAPFRAPVEAEQEQRQPSQEGRRAGQVEALAGVGGGILRDEEQAQGQSQRPDRHVDVEDRPPAEGLRQPAAQRGTHGQPEISHRGGQAEGAAALLGREVTGHDGRRVGGQHRPADGLQPAKDDQRARGPGRAAQR